MVGSFLCTPKVLWLLRSANVVKSTSTESRESQRSDHATLPNMVMWCEWSGHRYAVTHGNCWLVCLTAYKTVTWSFSSLINKCLVWVFEEEEMEQVQPSPEQSPTRYMLPDQHSEEKSTSIVDYSYNLYSPTKYPDPARKGKRVVKKEEAEKNPMTKAIKQEPERKTLIFLNSRPL